MKQIAVVGSNSKIKDEIKEIAELVGQDIAANKCVLVCGGLGGVMEAACRGAKQAGGLTLGILPSLDKNDANPYVDIIITTGMGYTRNFLVVSCADAVIAVAGRTGTLSEIAFALNLGKPVVLVQGSGGVTDTVHKILTQPIKQAPPQKAVKLAIELIRA